MKRFLTISSLLCLTVSLSAQIKEDSVYQVPEIIIEPVEDYSGVQEEVEVVPVTTLTDKQMKNTTVQSVGELAKFFPGILVKDYGGLGGLKTVSVRGLGAEHTTVTWDGIRVASEQSGQVDMSKYPLMGFEKVTLSKALQTDRTATATAYASAAVLSMTSQDHLDSGSYKLQGLMQYGSLDFFQGQLGGQVNITEKTYGSIYGRYVRALGDYNYHYANGDRQVDGTRLNNQMEALTLEGNLNTQLSKTLHLKTKLFYNNNSTELPGAIVFYNTTSNQQQRVEDLFAQLTLSYESKKWEVNYRLKAGHSYLEYTDPDFLNSTGGINDRYKQNEFFNSLASSYEFLPSGFLYIATDLITNSLNSNVEEMPSPLRLTSRSVVGLKGEASGLSWNANLLYTYLQESDEEVVLREEMPGFTPTLSLKYALNKHLAIRASYKETYRLPTFNELYYIRVGNKNLRSERATLWNAGIVISMRLRGVFSALSFSADAFYQQVDNKIIALPTQNLFVWSVQNIGEVNTQGFDLSLNLTSQKTPVGIFGFTGNYTYLQAVDVTNTESTTHNHQLPYIPYESGSTLFSWNYKAVTLGYTAVYSGFKFALAENISENVVEPWSQHDIVVTWEKALSRARIIIKAEVLNITDKNYDVIRYYPMPGRQWRMGVQVAI